MIASFLKIICLTTSGRTRFLLSDTVFPDEEKTRSEAALDAGMHSTRLANLANIGNCFSFDFHHCRHVTLLSLMRANFFHLVTSRLISTFNTSMELELLLISSGISSSNSSS